MAPIYCPPMAVCICCIDCCWAACFSFAAWRTFPTFSCASMYLETHLSTQLISPRWRSASLCFLDAHLLKHEAVSLLNRVVYISISVCAGERGVEEKQRWDIYAEEGQVKSNRLSVCKRRILIDESDNFMMCSEQILVWMTGNHWTLPLAQEHIKTWQRLVTLRSRISYQQTEGQAASAAAVLLLQRNSFYCLKK